MKNLKHTFALLKPSFLLLFFVQSAHFLRAQDTAALTSIQIINGDFVDFTTDNLGNIYLINQRQQIKKLDNHFDSVAVFNDVRKYGKLYSVDASNPFKIVLYYNEFATVVMLDRFLNVVNTVDLRQANILQCKAITRSYDNHIWLFDELDKKIKKIDDAGKLLLESADFRNLFDSPQKPVGIYDDNKYVYTYDSTKGFAIFDYYGALKKQIPAIGLQDVQVFSNGILGRDSTGLLFINPGNLDSKHQNLPAFILNAIKIKIAGSRLFSMPAAGSLQAFLY